MSQYKHLPIYRDTYRLLEVVTRHTRGFPKDMKYSLGEKLRCEVIELVVGIFKANSTNGVARADHAGRILERLQVVELMLRLCKDMRMLTVKQFSEAVELTYSVGRQAQGWSKSALLAES